MKNLSNERRREQWNSIHRHKIEKRKQKRRRQGKHGRSHAGGEGITQKIIECPSKFSLDPNFEEVIKVLQAIRAHSRGQKSDYIYVDFRPIKELSPAAALVLAAELDRWNHLLGSRGKGNRLQARDVKEWDPVVRRLLGNMGFFELLRTVNPIAEENDDTDTQYVRFRTGSQADGAVIYKLWKEDLEPLVGEVPNKARLYGAVTEAMTNVVQHAYDGQASRRMWWLSASYTATKNELVIIIFDQGVGIPNTLARNFPEQIRRIIGPDHAQMIRAAHDISRSASKQKNRGNGLRTDMREYLNKLDFHGRYCVTSLRGQYIFDKQVGGKTSEYLKNHQQELNGTLIEWRVYLQ